MLSFSVDKNHQVTISPFSILFAIATLLGVYGVFLLRSVFVLFFLAFIIMVALNPLVGLLEKKFKLPRISSIIMVYILLFCLLVSTTALVLPPLFTQMQSLIKALNIPVPVVQEELRSFEFTFANINVLADRLGGSVQFITSIITSTFTSLFTFVTLTVMSFYLLIDRPHLHKKLAWFTEKQIHLKFAEGFLNTIEHQLGGWVRAQLILMLAIAVITFIGLTLLGVPYALPLAILAGLLELLPNIGPTISAIPAVFIAAVRLNPILAGIVVLFYILVQQLENNLLVPKVMKENANVNPLIAILAILIGMELYSIIGGMLAIPTYIICRACYSEWKKAQHSN